MYRKHRDSVWTKIKVRTVRRGELRAPRIRILQPCSHLPNCFRIVHMVAFKDQSLQVPYNFNFCPLSESQRAFRRSERSASDTGFGWYDMKTILELLPKLLWRHPRPVSLALRSLRSLRHWPRLAKRTKIKVHTVLGRYGMVSMGW